jgi:GSCFA family protein
MPYNALSGKAFWKFCREADNFASDHIYSAKFPITPDTRIATAGSCFAQNIGRYLRASDATLLDVEPAPKGLGEPNMHRFGYGLYSGRYGNIYSAKQLAQLVQEVISQDIRAGIVWQRDGRYFDALRPTVEPEGLSSPQEVLAQRQDHIARLLSLFKTTDVFIFTLGLTECWLSRSSGIAFPTCPGVIAGTYDKAEHEFHNARYPEILNDLQDAFAGLKSLNPDMKLLLTVSPVPLTATATDTHVLSATTYSKSTLRAVAGDLASDNEDADYFPSYELITGAPFQGRFFKPNLRQVTRTGIDLVMSVFFGAHRALLQNPPVAMDATPPQQTMDDATDDAVCEDLLLEAFLK